MQAIGDYYIAGDAVVRGDVVLSAGVNVWFSSVLRGDLARITLGPRVNVQDGCVLHTDHDAPLNIEAGVVLGHRALLHGGRVGRDTLVGMGAILLSGSDVGEECLIAAGSLVTEGRRIHARCVSAAVETVRPVGQARKPDPRRRP
jgi:carbonic anhydrase/acetyltransferase-like protein (isoleucine patch superfamily)